MALRLDWLIWLWLLAPVLATGTPAQPPAPVLTLPARTDRVLLRGYLSSWVDSAGTGSLATVRQHDSQFRLISSPVPNFGFVEDQRSARPIWLRLQVRNPGRQPQAWLAEIDFWCFDALQLAVVDAQQRVLSVSPVQGWRMPADTRYRHHRHYWFPCTVPAGAVVTVYLRMVKNRGTRLVPLSLVRADAYERNTQGSYLFWGGILATLGFVTMMSLFFYLTTLDQIYAKYIVCLLGLVGFFIINDGFLNQFMFRAQFWLPRQNVYFLFPLLLFYSQLLFVRTFLSLRDTRAYRWHQISTAVLWVGVFCLLSLTAEWIQPLTPGAEWTLSRLFTIGYWLPMPVIGAYIAISIRQRLHVGEAWLYLVAVLPFYTLNIGQVLGNFRLLPTYEPMGDFAWYGLAALFEVLVLTFGIAYRYKTDRDQTEQLLRERTGQQQRMFEAEVQALALKNEMLLEKEHIARDLHDNVGAHLAFVVTNLSHISDLAERSPAERSPAERGSGGNGFGNGQPWAGRLRSIVDHTREAIKLLRETIWAIHQESFTADEFAERLNQYINRYVHETDGLQVDVQVSGAEQQRLTSMQVLNLFRIVQEALNNVLRHAQATHAQVRLHIEADGHIQLAVVDNGRGFAGPAEPNGQPHYGLQNMEARARELGGTFRIYADRGTVVDVQI